MGHVCPPSGSPSRDGLRFVNRDRICHMFARSYGCFRRRSMERLLGGGCRACSARKPRVAWWRSRRSFTWTQRRTCPRVQGPSVSSSGGRARDEGCHRSGSKWVEVERAQRWVEVCHFGSTSGPLRAQPADTSDKVGRSEPTPLPALWLVPMDTSHNHPRAP